MKKQLFLFFVLINAWHGFSQGPAKNAFLVKGILTNIEDGKYAYLSYSDPKDDKLKLDSGIIKDGSFHIRGSVSQPVTANLFLRKHGKERVVKMNGRNGFIPKPPLELFIVNGSTISVSGNSLEIWKASVKGNKYNDQFNAWKKLRDPYKEVGEYALDQSVEAQLVNDTVKARAYSDIQMFVGKKQEELKDEFVQKHRDYLISMILFKPAVYSISLTDLKKGFSQFSPEVKGSHYGRSIAETIMKLELTDIGRPAIDFTKKDPGGNTVSLAALKGKYVLLDFWGSWCGPCRASHPHLKELYSKYKNKGFEILGIAQESGDMERARQAWLKAIADDGITWLQVLNNEEREKMDVVKAYGINAFPTKILLDKEGKIIYRGVGDDDKFDQKLKEIFN